MSSRKDGRNDIWTAKIEPLAKLESSIKVYHAVSLR